MIEVAVNTKQVRRARNRARRKGLPANLSLQEWTETLQDFEQKCAYCGGGNIITLDHYIPLNCGGGSSIDNCVPCCPSCNLSKSGVLPEDAKLISRSAIQRVERYLELRRQGRRSSFEKIFLEEQGDEKKMHANYEEKANKRVTSKRVDQVLTSGERLTLFYDPQQVVLQISHTLPGDSPYPSSYQIAAQLTSTECLKLATKLLNAIAPPENELVLSSSQEVQTGNPWNI
jgi:hypothetical protein